MVLSIEPDYPLALPPKSVFDGLDHTGLARVLKPSIVNDPLEITLVGDVDEKAAVSLVASTFGALPARTAPAPPQRDTTFLRFPTAAGRPIRVTHHGSGDKALVLFDWPLYVATPSRRREEYAIKLLAAIFNDALRRRVRVDLGKSYAPEVVARTPDDADQGQLLASVESLPADIQQMSAEVRAIAARLQHGEITQEQLDAARAPLLAEDRQRSATNRPWALALSGSGTKDDDLRDFLSYADALASLQLDEIKKAAVVWLSNEPWTVLVEPATPNEGVTQ